MRYVCSYCHSAVEPSSEGDHDHLVCSNCGAEAGIEVVKESTPPAMRYFGAVLVAAGLVAIGGSLIGL